MSPPRSLHAKRWALVRQENSEKSCSIISDKLSMNDEGVISNNVPAVDIVPPPVDLDTTDIDGSDDDTTIPSVDFSERFDVLSQPDVSSKPLEINLKYTEEESEISVRSKKKKKMFRGPIQTAVQQSVNEVLFGVIGVDQDESGVEGSFVTKNAITRTSVCSENNMGQSFSDQVIVKKGLKRRNTRRPKGPGGEPFGGNSALSRQENNKCLIELEGDKDMLDFVENITSHQHSVSDSPVMNKTPLNGFKSSIQHTPHSITDDEDIPFTTPLMSSTFVTEHKVDSQVIEVMETDEAMRHNSFSSRDLPLKRDSYDAQYILDRGLVNEELRESNKRSHEVEGRSPDVLYINNQPDLLYTGTNECTSTYSDSEDIYSSDHHSSQGDLNNSILPPIHRHDVKKVMNTEEPDFLELERYFPTHQMRLFIGSWNMQSLKEVPNLVEEFLLPAEIEVLQDIYVLGTQECSPHRRDWEVSVQATLGPTHVLVRSECLGDIHLMVLVRREMIWYMREIQSTTVACGPGGVMRNKGAVGIILTFFGTSLLFITSHLAAQTSKVKERNMDYLRIAQYMNFSKSIISNVDSLDITDKVDCTFWFGDLNYRVTAERDVVDDLINQDMLEVLLNNDQLTTQMQTNQAFLGFSEGHIQFPPTFKFDPGTENYDTSPKQRVPSWTDRILYKSQHDAITPHVYSHCPYLKSSDHRPVYGVYMVNLQPMLLSSTIHATGWFDKRAYARGMKRRRILSEKVRSVHPNSLQSKHVRQKSIIKSAAKVVNKPVKKVLRSGTAAKKSIVCSVM